MGDTDRERWMRGERELLSLSAAGAKHGHTLRVIEVDGHRYVEVSEPGKCECIRRLALSETIHLLANITDEEMLRIPNRDRDAQGHEHDAKAGDHG